MTYRNPYPPMKIARHSSTAISYRKYIIVAGGSSDRGYISSVEVLDVMSRRWYSAQSLPRPRARMNSTLSGNILYLMGGWNYLANGTQEVYKVNVRTLISDTLHMTTSGVFPWQEIEETPLMHSAPLYIVYMPLVDVTVAIQAQPFTAMILTLTLGRNLFKSYLIHDTLVLAL